MSARRAKTTVSSQRLRGSAEPACTRRMDGRDLRSDGSALRGQVRERQAVRGMGGKLRGSQAEWSWHRLHVLAPHQRSQRLACVSQATMAWKESAADCVRPRIRQRPRWLPCPCRVHSRTRRREQGIMRNFRRSGTRQLSDQLSDYRVDDPYIQAHLYGPSSRLVLDLDDSPNALRDEEVATAWSKSNSSHAPGPLRALRQSQ